MTTLGEDPKIVSLATPSIYTKATWLRVFWATVAAKCALFWLEWARSARLTICSALSLR